MPLVAGDIITQARSQDPGFVEERHPNSVCLSYLDRYQRNLLLKVSEIDPSAYYDSFQISLPWADPDAGHAIPEDYLKIVGIQTWDPADQQYIVTVWARYADRLRDFYTPGVYIAKRTVFPLETDPKLWLNLDHIKVDYVPHPTALAATTEDLFFEPEAEECYVTALASYMARRGASEISSPAEFFLGEFAAAEKQLLDRYAFDGGVQVTQVEEVW